MNYKELKKRLKQAQKTNDFLINDLLTQINKNDVLKADLVQYQNNYLWALRQANETEKRNIKYLEWLNEAQKEAKDLRNFIKRHGLDTQYMLEN